MWTHARDGGRTSPKHNVLRDNYLRNINPWNKQAMSPRKYEIFQYIYIYIYFPTAQQSLEGQGLLIIEASR
jgi:hypothetical protein